MAQAFRTWTAGWTFTDSGVTRGATLFDGGSGLTSQVRDPAPLGAKEFLRLGVELR